MKKTLSAVIGAAFCIAMMLSLAACGTNTATQKGSEATSPASSEAVAPASSEAVAPSSSDAVTPASATADNFNGKKVYFAGPLFNQSEKDFNLQLTTLLESHGYQVFLPQRDGYLAAELEGKTEEEKTQMIFDKDYNEVLNADIVFMNLDGQSPDEGSCVELGVGYANGKRCYGVKTDARAVELNMDLNPMLAGCFTKIFKNFDGDKLIEELDQYLSEHEL